MDERRASPRHALRPALAGRLMFSGSPRPIHVAVLDVSASSVGFYLPHPLAVAQTAVLELVDGPVALRRAMELRVLFVRPANDGGHFVGGAFAQPLADGELAVLLAAQRAAQPAVSRTA